MGYGEAFARAWLTTHYIEEAEEIADRIGIIHGGSLVLAQDKKTLMQQQGTKQLRIQLKLPLNQIPPSFNSSALALSSDGYELIYT